MHLLLRSACIALPLVALGLACTDDGDEGNADEIGSESSSTESTSSESSSTSESGSTDSESSTESESGSESSTESESGSESSTDSESSSTDSSTESTSSESSSTESTSSESTSSESSSDTAETGFGNCSDVEATYDALVGDPTNTSCDVDAECHVVDGHCWMGLGGCWYVVNQNVQQTDLEVLADAYTALDCFGPICLCLQPPNAVGCVDGTCVPL
ncbi:hypothetical protein ACNOYE_30800 [Nannocystaceae bacterium ST9]